MSRVSLFSKADPKAKSKGTSKGRLIAERKFGDYRFDYLRGCKHDFDVKPDNCPFCLLVNASVRKILKEEEEVARQRRIASVINRAKLRYGLLDYWSRSQQSGLSDVILGYVAEIALSGRAVTALDSGFGGNELPIPDMADVLNILRRRKRIVTVGKYAATLIQAKLRQYFASIRVRRMLLSRFEFVKPNKNKKVNTPYFYDSQTQVVWQRLPALVAAERPASPTTMARRLGGEERKRTERLHKGRFSLQKAPYKDLWQYEDELVSRAKQLAVTRDVLHAAFKNLQEWTAKQAKISALAKYSGDGKGAAATGDADSGSGNKKKFLLSLTGSAPYSRAVGLSIVLSEGPLEDAFFRPSPSEAKSGPSSTPKEKDSRALQQEAKLTQREREREAKERVAAAAAAAAEEDIVPPLSPNELLIRLEERMLSRLLVEAPEEALQRLFCPDVLPAMMSAVNFSEDGTGVWMGNINYRNTHLDHQTSGGSSAEALSSEDKPEDKGLPGTEEIVPMSVCIRSLGFIDSGAGARDIFRLFFYEGELCAATQYSPWAYYRDISEHRDAVMQCIRVECSKPALREMIKLMFSRLKRKIATARRDDLQEVEEKEKGKGKEKKQLKLDLATFNTKPRTGDKPGGCIALYAPPETLLFGRQRHIYAPQLTDNEVLDLHREHKFLSKFDDWRSKVRTAQNNRMKNKSKEAGKGEDDAPLPIEKAPLRRLAALEVQELEGATIFVESNVGLPGGDRRVSERDYMQALSSKLAFTNTSIAHRLCTPFHVETQKDVPTGPTGNYDLLVIEMAISIDNIIERKAAALARATEGGGQPGQVVGRDTGMENGTLRPMGRKQGTPAPIAGGLKSRKEKEKVEDKEVRCELHQLVGIYSCDADQPPASLDLGLVSWSHFQQLHRESIKSESVGIVNFGDPLKLLVGGNQREWMHTNEQSGVSTYRCPLSSGRNGSFVFSILAAKPAVPYLIANLTKKVKRLIKLEEDD